MQLPGPVAASDPTDPSNPTGPPDPIWRPEWFFASESPTARAVLRIWLTPVALLVAIAASSAQARAQVGEEVEVGAPAGAGVPLVRRAFMTDQQFDQQIFGRTESIEDYRARLNQTLGARLRQLDRQYHLTDAQKDKLFLAGQGDIKRAVDRIEELRRKFQQARYERIALIECLQEARRLRSELGTVTLGIDSLLTKTMATTITHDQKARADDLLREYLSGTIERATIEAAARLVPVLDLSPAQHRRFERLLLSEIRPPRRFGGSTYAYVMYQLSRLPEAKVRPIFGDSQWKFLHDLLISWNDAGTFLENDGFVFDESRAQPRRPIAAPLPERRGLTGE
jgi:hypothetical protein